MKIQRLSKILLSANIRRRLLTTFLLSVCVVVPFSILTTILDQPTATTTATTTTTTTTATTTTTTTTALIQQRHSGCFSNKLQVMKHLKYSLIGRNVTNSVRYNHLCPWMKSRYNCAKNKTLPYGESAVDWKLILEHDDIQCNLWDLVHDLGGPIGIGESLMKKKKKRKQRNRRPTTKKRNNDNNDHRNSSSSSSSSSDNDDIIDNDRPFTVAIFGSSYLRQIFEALKCSWSRDITHTRMQKNAHFSISMAGLAARNGSLVRMDELGEMERMPLQWESDYICPLQNEQQYEENVVIPRNCNQGGYNQNQNQNQKYNDDLAVVEFGNKIRFYYLFRPQIYEDLSSVLQSKLDLDPEDVDVLLFNDGQEKTIQENKELLRIFQSTGAWQKKIVWPYFTFKAIQERDIGRWFGADNPWITKKPNGHACMPGPPDDEVNLLLYLIYTDKNL